MPDTLVWISGAAHGIGEGLARLVPYPDARVVNLDRDDSSPYETVRYDLTNPSTWQAVADHFTREVTAFDGRRVLFLQVGHASLGEGLATRADPSAYQTALIANGVGAIMLGFSFVRAVTARPDLDSGLMMMSSGAAAFNLPGQTAHSASKAAIEKWVKVIRRELATVEGAPWVVAVRPGMVDTPTARADATRDEADHPRVAQIRENLRTIAVDIDTAARRIWDALPPDPDTGLISFDPPPAQRRT